MPDEQYMTLDELYEMMASDAQREAAALEWAEATLAEVADEL
jgi:hypothetical protein